MGLLKTWSVQKKNKKHFKYFHWKDWWKTEHWDIKTITIIRLCLLYWKRMKSVLWESIDWFSSDRTGPWVPVSPLHLLNHPGTLPKNLHRKQTPLRGGRTISSSFGVTLDLAATGQRSVHDQWLAQAARWVTAAAVPPKLPAPPSLLATAPEGG